MSLQLVTKYMLILKYLRGDLGFLHFLLSFHLALFICILHLLFSF